MSLLQFLSRVFSIGKTPGSHYCTTTFDSDPCRYLTDELCIHVLMFKDAAGLARSAVVSREWRVLATHERLWETLCRRLWSSKVVQPSVRIGVPWQRQYTESLHDGRRSEVTIEDISQVMTWAVRMTDRIAGLIIREYEISDYPFRPDYTYVSPSFNFEPIPFKFCEDNGKRVGLQVEQDGQTFVAYVKRTGDWGWTLTATYGPGQIQWVALASNPA